MTRSIITTLALTLLLIPAAALADPGIRWKDYRTGKAIALQEKKKIILHFHAEWCPSCKKMREETFSNPEVIELMNERFVTVLVDTDKEPDIARAYRVRGIPDTWVLHPDEKPIGRVPGFVEPTRFLKILHLQSK